MPVSGAGPSIDAKPPTQPQEQVDPNSKSSLSRSKLAKDFDTFLVMLTTQLKHQDPLSPMDSTEFTNQLVQFANVEQQINANTNLENLIKVQQLNQTAMAIGYIGKTVEIPSATVPLQDGQASFSYTLPEEAQSLTILIKDASGKTVRQLTGSTDVGRHEVTWDGTDDYGVAVPDGNYTVTVAALNFENTEIDAATTAYGQVTGVASDEEGTLLALGDTVTRLEEVLTILQTPSAPAN